MLLFILEEGRHSSTTRVDWQAQSAPEMTTWPTNAPPSYLCLPVKGCRAPEVVAEQSQDRELAVFCHDYEY